MSSLDPGAALAAGLQFVTPNKRLARALRARHDDAQAATGATAWPAARAVPWSAWLTQLWHEALAAGALPDAQPLLAPGAAAFLWERIAGAHGTLLDPRGAAAAAADAWTTFHAWRNPGERFEGWGHAGIDDDAALFAGWAAQFEQALRAQDRLDGARLADALTQAAPAMPRWRGARVVLAGFLELDAQQRRLVQALRDAGMDIGELALPVPRAGRRHRVACASAADELRTAMAQARAWALDAPDARIGIVFDDLRERRAAIRAAADDVLCPEIAALADADRPRPYNLSLGERLLDVPLVATALHLVAWSAAPLALADAAAVMRARHLPGPPDAWRARAGLERYWREDGSLEIAFATLLKGLPRVDAALAQRWREVTPPGPARQAPAAWALAWRGWLAALGWPGDAPLGSAEWQARDAFWRALGEFAALGDVAGVLPRAEAIATLRASLARTVFQPEAQGARIHILGTLEASGLEFDRLWVAGLTATRWPGSATPNPLLPLAWQRQRGVPRADARRTLAFAQAATRAFAVAADDVIASHPQVEEDAPAVVSALIADWPERAPPAVAYGGRAADLAATAPPRERSDDSRAPALPMGAHTRGGAGLVETQSECAFRAFARYRLRTREWPDTGIGLAAHERGTVLHQAMAAFWRAVGDHARLHALDARAARAQVEAAVARALAEVPTVRWQALPAPVAAGEHERLCTVITAWIERFERSRPPFAVDACELELELALAGLVLRVRIDRVDALADGGTAVIDYKSGQAAGPARWFRPRPEGTQLGLYALALQGADPSADVRALAFARLKAGEIGVSGLAADDDAWPEVLPAVGRGRGKLPVATWPDVQAFWARDYAALADAFRMGDAAVDPRDGQVCNRCRMQALCRVEGMHDAEGDDDGDGAPGTD